MAQKAKLNIYTNENFKYKKIFKDFKRIFKYLSFELKERYKFTEASIWIVNSERIKELNYKHRSKNTITDVLSFPHNELEEGRYYIGDIFINEEIISSQAKEINSTIEMEYKFLFLHGLLHLHGYDHITDDEYEIMNAKQREVFRKLGIRNDHI